MPWRGSTCAGRLVEDEGVCRDILRAGCLQIVFKYHPDVDAVLRTVLEGDPDGRLVLLTDPADPLYDRLRARLKRSLGRSRDAR